MSCGFPVIKWRDGGLKLSGCISGDYCVSKDKAQSHSEKENACGPVNINHIWHWSEYQVWTTRPVVFD